MKERKAQVVLEEGQLDLVMENKKKPEQVAGKLNQDLSRLALSVCHACCVSRPSGYLVIMKMPTSRLQ